ncbi:MAG: hypothetical protein QXF15_00565 [Candidatus Aenigmatarchaeota archaeon]|nr:hypothetical protein [Candidatus Aenigmarchaeota archaeon]
MLKGQSITIVFMIFFFIIIILSITFLPDIQKNIKAAQITNEIQNVKTQISNCNSKLLETARTGIKNTCYIPAEIGKVTAKTEGIYYTIQADEKICDPHDWIEIDSEKHIWSKCLNNGYTLQYMWNFPNPLYVNGTITGNIYIYPASGGQGFEKNVKFRTITVVVAFNYVPGQEGKNIEFVRESVTDENVTLSVIIS